MNEKASAVATYGGSLTAVYFGFTPGEWQVIGIVGGIVIGVVGYLTNAYFGWQRLKMDRERANATR